MANEVVNKEQQKEKFSIVTRTGEKIFLDKQTVIKYVADNAQITDSEFNMFFQLCKVHKVNPFLKEAYIIKYGNTPATIVLDYKVFQQVADSTPTFKGMKHGIVVAKEDGTFEERAGEFKLPKETLIAGWCEVYRSDRDMPTKVYAMFDEFKGTKKDGALNSNWSTKPCFMICKVAKAQALREAFPNMFESNVYTSDEMDNITKAVVNDLNSPQKKTTVSNSIIPESEEEVIDVETGEVSKDEETQVEDTSKEEVDPSFADLVE